MYYLTYDNRDRVGAGAQVQRILSLFLLAKKFQLGYVHTGFLTDVYGFSDQTLLDRFNNLAELSSYNKTDFAETIQVPHFTQDLLTRIQQNPADNRDILLMIQGAHQFLDSNPSLLDDLFPVHFSWVSDQLHPTTTQVGIHIRRGWDVSRTVNPDRFVEAAVYLDYIRELRKILPAPCQFHIFSLEEILPELEGQELGEDIFLRIGEDVVETFQSLVNCDILFAAPSSFSYSAAMLRRKGIVLHNPFWHGYPQKHVCLTHPHDVHAHKDKILRAIGRE